MRRIVWAVFSLLWVCPCPAVWDLPQCYASQTACLLWWISQELRNVTEGMQERVFLHSFIDISQFLRLWYNLWFLKAVTILFYFNFEALASKPRVVVVIIIIISLTAPIYFPFAFSPKYIQFFFMCTCMVNRTALQNIVCLTRTYTQTFDACALRRNACPSWAIYYTLLYTSRMRSNKNPAVRVHYADTVCGPSCMHKNRLYYYLWGRRIVDHY